MGTAYANVSDITALGVSLTAQQSQAAEVLLDTASAKLRVLATERGKDIDAEISKVGEDYALLVKNTVVQAVIRALNSLDNSGSAAVSQGTESIGAYSLTATYINAGQSLYFLRNELKDLGLLRQIYGALNLYGGEE